MAGLHLTQRNIESRQDAALRQNFDSHGFSEILVFRKNTTCSSDLDGNISLTSTKGGAESTDSIQEGKAA
jgi:hypothetical protein